MAHMSTTSIGTAGERTAEIFLQNLGYVPWRRNVRFTFGELDLLMRYKDRLVIVEVKTCQNTSARPIESINRRKLRHLQLCWLALAQRYPQKLLQLDAVEVVNGQVSAHYQDIEVSW